MLVKSKRLKLITTEGQREKRKEKREKKVAAWLKG